MGYLLDSNVFIEAKRLHYGFDFCPAFGDWLHIKSLAGEVHSISRVADELVGRGDLKIPCVSPYSMLRREQARFVLGS